MAEAANDVAPGLPKVTGNPEVIKALEGVLSDARAGKVHGVAVIVAHGPEAVSLASAGGFGAAIVLGCEQMKRMLLDKLFAAQRSPILRPGRVM